MRALRNAVGMILLVAVVIGAALAVGVAYGGPSENGFLAQAPVNEAETPRGRPYPGDAEREAGLVAAERDRLDFVRELGGTVEWRVDGVEGPFRVATTPASTLVLPGRPDAYTIEELEQIAPDTFVRQPDGSILVSEHIVALPQATLDLSGDPVTIKLLSSPEAFVSIVSVGGVLRMAGGPSGPVSVSSFDPASGVGDTQTADGRAYVRAIGGVVDIQGAAFADLGFWSGETGGLALTGSDGGAQPALAADESGKGDGSEGEWSESVGSDGEWSAIDEAVTLTNGEIGNALEDRLPDAGPVSGVVRGATVTGGAYGVFVSEATGLTISESAVTGSLVDGIVLHRGVTESTIETTEARDNAMDGIVVDRSSTSIALSGVTAVDNGRNGVSIDGRPLADGPSANGVSDTGYGAVTVSGAIIADNARYGIEVRGGHDITIRENAFSAGLVGIVVDSAAIGVEIADNDMKEHDRQAIALRAGTVDAVIRGNRISSVETGIHLRNANAVIEGNDFADVSLHAVTLLGRAIGVRVIGNTIAGDGTTPIHDDALGGFSAGNDVENWQSAVTPDSVIKTLAQPLTIVWTVLAVLLVLTALVGRPRHGLRHPYPEHAPLTQLSRGVVSPDAVREARS